MNTLFLALGLAVAPGLIGTTRAALSPPPAGTAAPSDLGQGLHFFRPVALTAEINSLIVGAAATPAIVLDLRGITADAPSTAALLTALRARTVGKGLCLILIAPDTAPALLAALTSAPPRCLTVGRADGACHPDIIVATTAESDERARAALTAGTPLAELFTAATNKPRHDEAELAKDHATVKTPPADGESDGAEAKVPAPKPATQDTTSPKEPPLVDAVLQRAAQVHRGLLALGKIK